MTQTLSAVDTQSSSLATDVISGTMVLYVYMKVFTGRITRKPEEFPPSTKEIF
jgi:hypothetical protein